MQPDEAKKNTEIIQSISEFLPLGYLYLLLLGIVSDSIFYGFLGINIISYSSVLDVLLSPLVHISDSLIFSSMMLVIPLMSYFYVFLIKKLYLWRKKKTNHLLEQPLSVLWLFMTAIFIFSMFVGFGMGGGARTKQKIAQGRFKPTHSLVFDDLHNEEVLLIGNNSSYVFYVSKGDSVVSISPIQENIVKIRALKNK